MAKEDDRNLQLQSACKNVDELRQQVENSQKEIAQYVAKITEFEKQITQYRDERNRAYDERDHLLTLRQSLQNKLDFVTNDRKILNEKLTIAINEKNKAIVHKEDVCAKELELERRERHMESDMRLLRERVECSSNSLNKALAETHAQRQQSSQERMQLEANLARVSKERELAQKDIEMLTNQNVEHEQQIKELVEKLQATHNSMAKQTESFELELASQKNLAHLYQQAEGDSKAMIDELSEGIIYTSNIIIYNNSI